MNLQERKEQRNALIVAARAGDREARRRLEEEFGTKVYVGPEAEARAMPAPPPPPKEHTMSPVGRWGEVRDVPEDLPREFADAIERSGKTKKDVADEIKDSDGKPLGYFDIGPILSGKKARVGKDLVVAIRTWISGVNESAPARDEEETAAETEPATEPPPPREPSPAPELAASAEKVAEPEPEVLPARVEQPSQAAGAIQEALAGVTAAMSSSGDQAGRSRRVKVRVVEVEADF